MFFRYRTILKEKQNHVTNLEKQFDDIQKDTVKLQKFSSQNLEKQVEEILTSVQDLYDTRKEIVNSKKKLQQDINQFKEDLSNQEVCVYCSNQISNYILDLIEKLLHFAFDHVVPY